MKLFMKRLFGLIFIFLLTVSLFSGALFSSSKQAKAIEGAVEIPPPDFILAAVSQPPPVTEPDPDPPATPATELDPDPPATPATEPAPTTGDPVGVTTTSEQPAAASSSNTVASLEPPTSVVAADLENDQGGTIKLSWKKSASTITGYNLYRSTIKDKDFVKITTPQKGDETYNDSGAATGITYYYYLRSYSSSGESKSSTTVNAASVDNLAPATPVSVTAKFDADNKVINLKWNSNTELDLAGYVIKFGTDENNLTETTEVDKAATSAKLTRLKSTGNYFIQVSAKDTHNNISLPAKANVNVTKASDPESSSSVDWKKTLTSPLGLGGIVLAVLLAGVFIYLFIRDKKKKIPKKEPEKIAEKPVETKPAETKPSE